jgi:hypothetical protein
VGTVATPDALVRIWVVSVPVETNVAEVRFVGAVKDTGVPGYGCPAPSRTWTESAVANGVPTSVDWPFPATMTIELGGLLVFVSWYDPEAVPDVAVTE